MFLFLYFTFTLTLYYVLPRGARNPFLFIASLVFYGYGEPLLILLMVGSIAVNFAFGIALEKRREQGRSAKGLLALNVVFNLVLLGFFKYAAFFVDTLKLIPGLSALNTPDIPLPVGISFYTFQTMSYIIDVYRGACRAQRNFVTLGTYVALFPQLIAGPIVRYVDVEHQLSHRRENWEMFNNGVKLFLVGLAKKVLIANPLGEMWTVLKDTPDTNGFLGSWMGILAFTLQIYFDFSGYSDMARGLGNMFGFSFVKNFDFPYISKSITEFWRRWHMTLGTWFREYVYIPLGGNRCKAPRHIFNLLVVWFLTGMWHGASWNFILWGVYFGILLILEKFVLHKALKALPAVFSHLYALFFIVIGWVLFEFLDMTALWTYLGSMFSGPCIGETAAVYALSYLPLMLVAAVLCTPLPKRLFLRLSAMRFGWALETTAALLVLLLSTAALVGDSYNAFLYFRF